jgi:hypothetical protein
MFPIVARVDQGCALTRSLAKKSPIWILLEYSVWFQGLHFHNSSYIMAISLRVEDFFLVTVLLWTAGLAGMSLVSNYIYHKSRPPRESTKHKLATFLRAVV